MRPFKEQQQQQARNLYFQSDLSRNQIAEQVGVSEKTVYLWTKQGDWQKLKSASRLMPSMLVEHFISQVQELNENIMSRPMGRRYPTPQEAETQRKLIVTAERIKKKGTVGEYMELMQKFMEWLQPKDFELTKTFTNLADSFFYDSKLGSFHPYDIEYDQPTLMSGARSGNPKPQPSDPDNPQPFIDPNQLSLFPESNNTSLSFGEGRGEAPLASLREAGIAHVPGAPKQSHDDTNNLQPNEHETTGTLSLSPLKDEYETTGTPSLSPLKDEHETTGNNLNPPCEAPTAYFSPSPEPQQEITDHEITPEIPLLRGDSPGSTNVDNGQGCVQLSNEQKPDRKKPPKDTSISIGYIGTQEEVLPDGTTILEIKKEDPGIQKFSIGGAIYYIKKE
jgi:hypothetical protein